MDTNGLRTVSFHTLDEDARPAVEALRAERPSLRGFAVAEAVGLDNLDPETAARQHLRQALASTALPGLEAPEVNGTESELKTLGTESLPLTNTRTVKFRQMYHKVPVYGSLVTVELDPANELLSIRSALGDPANVDPVARLSPSEAWERVREVAGPDAQSQDGAPPRLSFYFDDAVGRWRLVYILEDVSVRSRGSNQMEGLDPLLTALLMDYVVDAQSGDIVAELPRTPTVTWDSGAPEPPTPPGVLFPTFAPGTQEVDELDGLGQLRTIRFVANTAGTGRLQDPVLGIMTFDFRFRDLETSPLPGIDVVNPPTPWSPAAVSAHANAAEVATFLRDTLSRNGIDNRGGALISNINCIVASQSPDGRQWRNAAWFRRQMVYGQRSVSGTLRSYAVGLDVVAHEMFHGVTDLSARLEYAGETGALNESYSDIFGVIVSNFSQLDISQWNWEMGEELDGTGIPIRDLSNPRRRGQPDHMRDFQRLPLDVDNGGVHGNSGIHNKAAFNLITTRDAQGNFLFSSASVAALFYVALTQFLSRNSRFRDSREALTLVARTLFRTDPARAEKIAAIDAAFDTVGIA